jgi:hypothetical protein
VTITLQAESRAVIVTIMIAMGLRSNRFSSSERAPVKNAAYGIPISAAAVSNGNRIK